MVYVLDANVFIEAARRYYAFDLVPKFWTSLTNLVEAGKICSIDRVGAEIKEDAIREWIDDHGGFADGFASTDATDIATNYATVMTWVSGQAQFTDAAKAEFARGADGWLIAYAKVNGMTLVTHEVFRADVKRTVPIPNVCRAIEVPYADTFEMLRALGVKL